MTQDTEYISFCTIGMPGKGQIEAVRGGQVVFNHLNNNYVPSRTIDRTWFDVEPTPHISLSLRITVTGQTGSSDIEFAKIENNRWKVYKTISIQDYYNEIRRR